jgi:ABC-type Mn2+/Zn2+ transport system permease subunit
LVFVGALSVLVVGSVVVTYGEWNFATFEPLGARAAGYAVGLLERDSLERVSSFHPDA